MLAKLGAMGTCTAAMASSMPGTRQTRVPVHSIHVCSPQQQRFRGFVWILRAASLAANPVWSAALRRR